MSPVSSVITATWDWSLSPHLTQEPGVYNSQVFVTIVRETPITVTANVLCTAMNREGATPSGMFSLNRGKSTDYTGHATTCLQTRD